MSGRTAGMWGEGSWEGMKERSGMENQKGGQQMSRIWIVVEMRGLGGENESPSWANGSSCGTNGFWGQRKSEEEGLREKKADNRNLWNLTLHQLPIAKWWIMKHSWFYVQQVQQISLKFSIIQTLHCPAPSRSLFDAHFYDSLLRSQNSAGSHVHTLNKHTNGQS